MLDSGIYHDELYRVERMCGIRGAVRVVGVVCVAVVGREQDNIVVGNGCLDNFLYAFVDLGDGPADGGEYAGMAHHVSVGEIEDNHVLFAGVQHFNELFRHFLCAHFRKQVVCRDLR